MTERPWEHECRICHDRFDVAVWHCPRCAHHWSIEHDDMCDNCDALRPDADGG